MLPDAMVNGVPLAGRIGLRGTLKIHRVESRVVRGGLMRHEIWAQHLTVDDPPCARLALSTLNAWRASVCERALATDRLVAAQWIETKYGAELVAVELI